MRLTDRLAHPMKRGHDRTLTEHRSSSISHCLSSEGAVVPDLRDMIFRRTTWVLVSVEP